MAIDPPYRTDPFRNIINVHWGPTTQPDWWDPQAHDVLSVYYFTYHGDSNTFIYTAWGEELFQIQTQSFPHGPAVVGSTNVSGMSASFTLTDAENNTIIFTFDLSGAYPKYGPTSEAFELWIVSGSGGYDVYTVTERTKEDFGPNPPYKLYDDLFSWDGELAVVIPTTRSLELVSWNFVRHVDC